MSGIPATKNSFLPRMNEQMSFLNQVRFTYFSKRPLSSLNPSLQGLPQCLSCLVPSWQYATRVVFINTNPTMSPSFRNPGNNSIVPLFSHSAVAHKMAPIRAPLASSVSSPATFSFTCHARAQKSQTGSRVKLCLQG